MKQQHTPYTLHEQGNEFRVEADFGNGSETVGWIHANHSKASEWIHAANCHEELVEALELLLSNPQFQRERAMQVLARV